MNTASSKEIRIHNEYERWIDSVLDNKLRTELLEMSESDKEDAFYKDLNFGTGGLRGVIGAGTNRMNIYVVGKASQGLANYLLKRYVEPSVAIGYDSRNFSKEFATVAAEVFAANGVKVYLWPYLNPVPTLSYAVRYLGASAGIMITASHNPAKYNGYKVYGSDGCQITTEASDSIYKEITNIDCFCDVIKTNFDEAIEKGSIQYITEDVMDAYIKEVKHQSVLFGDEINRGISIVYSPLNGTGYLPVTRTLNELGYTNISVVEEQRLPDGNFATCPYPNPEVTEAMQLGIEYAQRLGADLLLATDPDCDRLGIAVRNSKDEYVLLTGNEVGMLLLDYICAQRAKHNKMPNEPVFIKTIVTSDTAEQIAKSYGVDVINTLTGFKFIGEQIGLLERIGREQDFICGFEESYGYLTGAYVRDKDGVNAACMVCEMYCYYASKGVSLLDKLGELYDTYGYRLNSLINFQFEGSNGMKQMHNIMSSLRINNHTLGELNISGIVDYSIGIDGLPEADVIKFILEDGSSIIIRPSGTEPKLKAYLSVVAKDMKDALRKRTRIEGILNGQF